MQHRTRRLVIGFSASLLLSLGVLAACSDNTTSPLPSSNRNDAGRTDDDDTDPDDTDPGTRDGGGNCDGAPKASSHDNIYCFAGNDGGGCDPQLNQTCCSDEKGPDGKFLPARCVELSGNSCNFAPDSGGREWQCTEPDHCLTAACCAIKGTRGNPQAQVDTKDFPGCGNYYNNDNSGAFVGGTQCKDSCDSDELELCARNSDCTKGKCRFFKLANRFTGVCKE